MAESSSSLLQRIQARLNNNKENQQIIFADSDADDDENESESDIDDNITLTECVDVVKRKSQDQNSSFTRLIKPNVSTGISNHKPNLKEVSFLEVQFGHHQGVDYSVAYLG